MAVAISIVLLAMYVPTWLGFPLWVPLLTVAVAGGLVGAFLDQLLGRR